MNKSTSHALTSSYPYRWCGRASAPAINTGKGDTNSSLRRSRPLLLLLLSCIFLTRGAAPAAQASAPADPIYFWNIQAIDATRLARNPPPVASLLFATYHVAIFDAVNSLSRNYHPWLVDEPAPTGANPAAAAAGAAYTALKALWGDSSNPHNFDVAYEQALAEIPAGESREAGLRWGRHVAELVLQKRAAARPANVAERSWSSTAPGKWRETPPGFRPPVTPWIATVQPFAMLKPDQFRAPPPPAVDSPQHALELAYVCRVGARDGGERTADQTQTSVFWSDDLGTCTPPGHWNLIARDLWKPQNLSLEVAARLFALLNIAEADAAISCWDTKFHYLTWRPETGIRELSREINPQSVPHPEFIPNMVTPAHPDYTSGHSTFSAAACRLLQRILGRDDVEFATTSDGLPGAVRSYHSLSAARDEIGISRVYAGIHTMSGNLAGLEAGRQVGDWVFEHALQPR